MKSDKFEVYSCKNCHYTYEKGFYECPNCKHKNENFNKESLNNPLLFIKKHNLLLSLVIGLLISFVLSSLIQIIIMEILSSNGYNETKIINFIYDGNVLYTISLVIYILTIGSIFLINKDYLKYIFKINKRLKNLLIGFLLGLAMIGLNLLYNNLIHKFINNEINSNQILIINTIKDNYILSFFAIVIFAPLSEELVYRFSLFGFINKYNKIIAYLISILVFAIIHIDFTSTNLNVELISLPGYLISSAFLVFIYDKFSLEGSYIAHLTNNLLSYILVFFQ